MLARAALWRLGVPFGEREHVCALVRHHQVPFFGLERSGSAGPRSAAGGRRGGSIDREDATRLAQRLSLILRHDWLVAVADADARGRRCADPADQVRIVEHCALWREHARELAILDRAQPFASPHTRRAWHESPTRAPGVLAYDDCDLEVVVMAGLPASGKDTWLRAHRPELPVISLDDVRAELDVDAGDTPRLRHRGRARARARLPAREDVVRVERDEPVAPAARAAARAVPRLSRAHARRLLRDHGGRPARSQPRAPRAGPARRDRAHARALDRPRSDGGARGHLRRAGQRRSELAAPSRATRGVLLRIAERFARR